MFYRNIICDQKTCDGITIMVKVSAINFLTKRFRVALIGLLDLMTLPFVLISKITETQRIFGI